MSFLHGPFLPFSENPGRIGSFSRGVGLVLPEKGCFIDFSDSFAKSGCPGRGFCQFLLKVALLDFPFRPFWSLSALFWTVPGSSVKRGCPGALKRTILKRALKVHKSDEFHPFLTPVPEYQNPRKVTFWSYTFDSVLDLVKTCRFCTSKRSVLVTFMTFYDLF